MRTLRYLVLLVTFTNCGGSISGLPPEFQQRYQKYFDVALDSIEIREESSIYFSYAMGSTIRLASGIVVDYSDPNYVALILHEIEHSDQYLRYGTWGFTKKYSSNAINAKLVHDNLAMEKEADAKAAEALIGEYPDQFKLINGKLAKLKGTEL